MYRVKTWFESLGILAFLWLIAFLWIVPAVEADLTRKAVAALRAPDAAQQPADLAERIQLRGRDLSLSGADLDSAAGQGQAKARPTLAALNNLAGVRRVIDERTPPPKIKPVQAIRQEVEIPAAIRVETVQPSADIQIPAPVLPEIPPPPGLPAVPPAVRFSTQR